MRSQSWRTELGQAQIVQDDIAPLALGKAYLERGAVNSAEKVLTGIDPEVAGMRGNGKKFVWISALGEVYRKQGKLHLAAATYHPLLDVVGEQPLEAAYFTFHYDLGRLYYEWDQLEKAQQYFQWCLDTIEQQRLLRTWSFEGYIGLAWSRWAAGRSHAAAEALQAAETIAQRSGHASSSERVKAHWARFWLRQGDLAAASDQLRQVGLAPAAPVPYQRQFEALTLARVLIHQGHAAQAIPLLERHLRAARKAGRGGDVIEILALTALAYQAQGDMAKAATALANALCRGERDGFIRTFVDEGAPMTHLLQHSAAQGITLVYVRDLLAAFAPAPVDFGPDQGQTVAALVEPLSQRELEVLRLVASGSPNEDIAQRLCISPTTVKKHLSNILGKLGAKNRTQAAAKARELHLLD